MEMNLLKGYLDFTGGEDIRQTAEDYLIDGRQQSLSLLREGLTLDGNFKVPFIVFACRSTQVVDKILFARPDDSVKTLLENLKYTVLKDGANGFERTMNFDATQERFMKVTLPHVLQAKENHDEEYASRFIRYCTNLSYINQFDPTITVVFEKIASGHENALPETHTCEKEICFPLTAYDANVDTLSLMLDTAMEWSPEGHDISMA